MNICPQCKTTNPEAAKDCLQCATPLPLDTGLTCPACQQMVPYGNRFCGQCGTRMPEERHCTGCGSPLPAGNRFCGQCGMAVQTATAAALPVESSGIQGVEPSGRMAESPEPKWWTLPGQSNGSAVTKGVYSLDNARRCQTSQSADKIWGHLRSLMPMDMSNKIDVDAHISGEQREVTVLFLDVTNFTAASHRLDSEDIYLIVDEAMSLLVEIVYKYEGTVDKFTGDGLIALFGAPIAHENDPERALRASLEMLQVLQPLRQRTLAQHSFDFQVRIGVNTGLVIAGSLGSDLHMEYTVIGDTVNMASRLETAAQPSSILVSFSTYQRTRPLFNFVSLPPMNVKGYIEPVRAYRPVQVREQPGSVRGLPGLRVRLIGRSHDIARLQKAMEIVQNEGQRRISLITGDAGLGKSRLVVEFCEGLAARQIPYYQGNCLAYARSRSMWVVADIIRDMIPITEIDPVDFQINQIRAFIAEHALDEEEVLPVLLHVLELMPLEQDKTDDPRWSVAGGFQNWINNILRKVLTVFRDAPFVLIFDDLHWVDPDSRELIISLIQSSDNLPLHLILVSRDFERLTVIRPIIDVCASMTQGLDDIRLRALSVDESRLLVNQLVHQTSSEIEELNEAIVARAEGNPFYTEEIVRMLMDKGGIIEQGNEWVATNRAKELLRTVPGTLRGLILARFDQLPPELRHTLQQAAVLGRSFPARLLEKLHNAGMEGVLAHLTELVNRHFLQEDLNSAYPGFSFRHTLIQQAVYATLLKRERRRLHGLVAEVIKDTNFWLPEEQAEALAYHYSESSNPDKAIPYLVAGSDRATQHPLFKTANGRSHLSYQQ